MDLDETCTDVLEVGVELADRFGAALILVHVWDVAGYPYTSLATSIVRRTIEAAAHDAFDAVLTNAKRRTPGVTGILKEGTAWREVLAAAEQSRADLLILGTHSRRGLPRALLGSVAEKIVRMSPVPVLTVPVPHNGRAGASP